MKLYNIVIIATLKILAGRRFVVRQVVVIFLVISLELNSIYLDPLKLEDRNGGISLEGLIVARNVSTPNLVLPGGSSTQFYSPGEPNASL